MAEQKQGVPAPDRAADDKEVPVETEESGAGYGNNAGQQGAADIEDET